MLDSIQSGARKLGSSWGSTEQEFNQEHADELVLRDQQDQLDSEGKKHLEGPDIPPGYYCGDCRMQFTRVSDLDRDLNKAVAHGVARTPVRIVRQKYVGGCLEEVYADVSGRCHTKQK